MAATRYSARPRRQPAASAIMALLLAVAGCGGTPARDPAQGSTQRAGKTQTPATFKAAPEDLLLADALRRQTVESNAEPALVLVEAAAQQAPQRVDIAWLHVQLCMRVTGCQPEALEARLRQLDPGNASAWIGALERARQGKDAAAENAVLDAMSRSQRFDIYWNSLVAHLAIALNQTGAGGTPRSARSQSATPQSATPLTDNLNEVIGWLSDIALPAFQPVSDACSQERLANPAVATRCGALSQVLQRGDSYLAEGIGLGIAEHLAAPESPRAIIVDERIHQTRYQRDTAGEIIATQLERERFTHQLLQLMSHLKREQDVYVAVIRWAGQPVMPPD